MKGVTKSLGQVEKDIKELTAVIAKLKTSEECALFLNDLCTPGELRAMAERWKVVSLLAQETPYRKIYEFTGVSTATITRVARCLNYGKSGYRLILKRLRKGGP